MSWSGSSKRPPCVASEGLSARQIHSRGHCHGRGRVNTVDPRLALVDNGEAARSPLVVKDLVGDNDVCSNAFKTLHAGPALKLTFLGIHLYFSFRDRDGQGEFNEGLAAFDPQGRSECRVVSAVAVRCWIRASRPNVDPDRDLRHKWSAREQGACRRICLVPVAPWPAPMPNGLELSRPDALGSPSPTLQRIQREL